MIHFIFAKFQILLLTIVFDGQFVPIKWSLELVLPVSTNLLVFYYAIKNIPKIALIINIFTIFICIILWASDHIKYLHPGKILIIVLNS